MIRRDRENHPGTRGVGDAANVGQATPSGRWAPTLPNGRYLLQTRRIARTTRACVLGLILLLLSPRPAFAGGVSPEPPSRSKTVDAPMRGFRAYGPPPAAKADTRPAQAATADAPPRTACIMVDFNLQLAVAKPYRKELKEQEKTIEADVRRVARGIFDHLGFTVVAADGPVEAGVDYILRVSVRGNAQQSRRGKITEITSTASLSSHFRQVEGRSSTHATPTRSWSSSSQGASVGNGVYRLVNPHLRFSMALTSGRKPGPTPVLTIARSIADVVPESFARVLAAAIPPDTRDPRGFAFGPSELEQLVKMLRIQGAAQNSDIVHCLARKACMDVRRLKNKRKRARKRPGATRTSFWRLPGGAFEVDSPYVDALVTLGPSILPLLEKELEPDPLAIVDAAVILSVIDRIRPLSTETLQSWINSTDRRLERHAMYLLNPTDENARRQRRPTSSRGDRRINWPTLRTRR